MNIILLAVFILGAAALFLSVFLIFDVWITYSKFAPFARSGRRKVNIMFELAEVRPGEVVVDLGSGDGTLVIEAARRGARAIGVEINPLLVWISRWRARWRNAEDTVVIIRGDIKNYPLRGADVIFLYLMPKGMEQLQNKIVSEAKSGARIVSNSFPLPNLQPSKEAERTYLYKI